jgi:hypothetical protein
MANKLCLLKYLLMNVYNLDAWFIAKCILIAILNYNAYYGGYRAPRNEAESSFELHL